ncbi:EAL domain-containing protein [Marinobacter qingdaonensis]|uniref:EAL domain-containing protein n=1 Tax=Marinobacter qingdaonensis TaxID=3108486 RepID=A0ABU5NVN9_9GAMM|nr:EAL domain-containing protein [Marinobacter sp. ASW11-75]MEA1079870.1 EAL domain-containing protein [Marinobacter sp. ASW11-75]
MSAEQEVTAPSLTAIGLAASAGGLEALTDTLSSFDNLDGLVLIVAQHTSPEYESLLPSILSKSLQREVTVAHPGQRLTAGSILVIPPGFDGVVENQQIVLKKSSRSGSPHPSANALFVSLAETFGTNAVAIVLSGTGSDGAVGARAIKTRGGFVIAQEPDTAKYDGMPKATIAATAVDFILAPADMGNVIPNLRDRKPPRQPEAPDELEREPFSALFDTLQSTYNIDFRQYKDNTIFRRLSRRMLATNHTELDDYARFAAKNPNELNLLYQDLIISVTSFFRDPGIFHSVKPYLETLLKTKSPGDEIRVWVPGCATGEEAYTLAILIDQLLGSLTQSYRIQIFATDIDDGALSIARKGFYEAYSLRELDPEVRDTYFQPMGSGYQIRDFVHERILFAHHNLTLDPPFLHLDVISCRNVMIYFKPELQQKVLDIFHYGLQPKGLLLLGKSEGIASATSFENVDSRIKLFRKVPGSHAKAIQSYAQRRAENRTKPGKRAEALTRMSMEESVRQAISDQIIDRGFVVDATLEIQYIYGDLSPISQVARGKPTFNVQGLIAPQYLAELKSLIYRLRKDRVAARSAPVYDDHTLTFFEGTALEGLDQNDVELFFIRYEQQAINHPPLDGAAADSQTVMHLQHELSVNREHLQTAMEELQTSNEELQSVNEELQSSNEELQSTNEELETANEELQSSNEELVTVNEELQVKTEALNQLNSDLLNLQNSLPHPMLLVDHDLNIVHHNTACHEIFKYEFGLQGHRLTALSTEYQLPNLATLIDEACRNHKEQFVQIVGEQRYWLTVTPYENSEGRHTGAVLIFWNNTELLNTHQDLQDSITRSNLQGRALEAAQQGITIADATRTTMPLVYANDAFTRMTGYSKEEVFGRNCRFLQGPGTSPEARERLSQAVAEGRHFSGQLVNYRKDGSEFYNWLELSPIFEGNKLTHFVGIQTDVTDLVQSEKDSAFSRSVFENTQESILILSEDQAIQYLNPAANRLLGSTRKDLIGQPLQGVASLQTIKAHHSFDSVWRTVRKQKRWQGQLVLKLPHDSVALLVSINLVRGPDNIAPHYVMLASDITELKKREKELKRLATIDPLTNLPNRTLFRERLQEAVARAKRKSERFALMFLDMDNFKRINDTLGHKTGDMVLKHLAQSVGGLIRENDTFGRISGDEFVLILDALSDPSDAHQLAQRIIDEISRPYKLDSGDLLLSVSVGVAIFPEDGDSAELLLRNADLAMYRAKQRGKAQVGFVDPERSGVLWEQLQLEAALRRGLVDGEEVGLHLNFQPIYDAGNVNVVNGFEVLVRWDHPDLGQLPPDRFLPIARSAGFAKRLDLWVFRRFLSHYAEWHHAHPGVSGYRFALNIDPSNMSLLTRSQISALLSNLDDDVNRPRLTLEITEHGLIDHNDELREGLDSLEAMDVRISIDDFGSGFSNFVYITDLVSIREIKLDRAIVTEIETNPAKLKRLRAIIKMLKEIGYHIAIEGVEHEAQLDLLAGAGHDCVQGFLLSRPLTAEQTETLISTQVHTGDDTAPVAR